MPVKILLADKSITIQKVVEMLFSGKEYEVTCVSDGESALAEAVRIAPNVVLADVDLPRIDGYSFASRLKETPALSKVPVVLMLSRDDVYDAMKGKLAGIVDTIAKPFESQDLIGKMKKALSGAPMPAETPAAAASPRLAAARPMPAVAPPPPLPKPKEAVPSDIFDIIEEAPAKAAGKEVPSPPQKQETVGKSAKPEEEMFEVEPEYEVEVEPETEKPEMPVASPFPQPPAAAPDAFDTNRIFGREPVAAAEANAPVFEPSVEVDASSAEPAPPSFDFSGPLPTEAVEALPVGQKAMDEMREGLGLGEEAAQADRHPDIVSFESLDMASRPSHEDYTFAPPAAVTRSAPAAAPAAERPAMVSPRFPEVSDEMLRGVAKESIEKAMRQVLERIAWEVIPELAERLIREEIERLKAETK